MTGESLPALIISLCRGMSVALPPLSKEAPTTAGFFDLFSLPESLALILPSLSLFLCRLGQYYSFKWKRNRKKWGSKSRAIPHLQMLGYSPANELATHPGVYPPSNTLARDPARDTVIPKKETLNRRLKKTNQVAKERHRRHCRRRDLCHRNES